MCLILTGAYQMLPEPGQYPSPFPKVPAVVAPVHPEAIMPSFPDQDVGQLVCLLCMFALCVPYRYEERNVSSKLSSELTWNPGVDWVGNRVHEELLKLVNYFWI